jgi:DNA-directed RNA polymerase specialized sigma24 family protein
MNIDRDYVYSRLYDWGFWQKTARNPKLKHSTSQVDTPLQKKRIVKPIYRSETAELLDNIMVNYLPRDYIDVLELTFVQNRSNIDAASAMGCSIKTFTNKRREAISMLFGILLVKLTS